MHVPFSNLRWSEEELGTFEAFDTCLLAHLSHRFRISLLRVTVAGSFSFCCL